MGANWQLVCGAALHWASLLYQGVEFSPALVSPADGSMATTPLAALVAIAFSLRSHALENRRIRTATVGVCIAAGIALLGLTLFAPEADSPLIGPYFAAFHLLAAANIVIPVLLWGYAFASLDKRAAGRNAIYTALVAFALAMVIAMLSQWCGELGGCLNIVARCGSGVVLARGTIYFSESERAITHGANGPRLARFYGGRVLMGVAIGALLVTVPGHLASPWLMAAEAALCLVLLYLLGTKGRGLVQEIVPVAPLTIAVLLWFPFCGVGGGVLSSMGYLVIWLSWLFVSSFQLSEIVPVAPLTIAVLLWFPFCGVGGGVLSSMGYLVIWLSWLFVSSFQLSGLRESFGTSGAFLSASEKAALLVGWSIGLYAGGPIMTPGVAGPLSFIAVAATLIWATTSSLRTIYSRQEDDFASRANREHADHDALILAELRERFDLTAREAEIAFMLSQGHSRPGICSQLGISDGTVRAHSSHIYTKLGIHRRDELILAVQAIEKGLLDR